MPADLDRADQDVRQARPADVEDIHRLVVELAEYERSADRVEATPAHLATALFGPSPTAEALVATVDGSVVGFALFFTTYSTWTGVPGLYLEDLYVRPETRGRGLGRALLAELAAIAVRRGHARVEWAVLDWNEPAVGFYKSLAARAMEEWTVYRLSGDALAGLAETRHR